MPKALSTSPAAARRNLSGNITPARMRRFVAERDRQNARRRNAAGARASGRGR